MFDLFLTFMVIFHFFIFYFLFLFSCFTKRASLMWDGFQSFSAIWNLIWQNNNKATTQQHNAKWQHHFHASLPSKGRSLGAAKCVCARKSVLTWTHASEELLQAGKRSSGWRGHPLDLIGLWIRAESCGKIGVCQILPSETQLQLKPQLSWVPCLKRDWAQKILLTPTYCYNLPTSSRRGSAIVKCTPFAIVHIGMVKQVGLCNKIMLAAP